jgi:predicted Zn-dependent protease
MAVQSKQLTKRATQAARSLMAKGLAWEMPDEAITILESDEAFAFSHPGGYVYLSTALFALCASEEELRFVIAHEMGHLELKHALKRLETEKARMAGLSTVQQLYDLIATGYTPAQEYEADAWALRLLLKLDMTRRECLAFLRRFQGYSESHDFANGRKKPKSGVAERTQEIENHYRSHPATWDRLDRLEKALDQLKPRAALPK